MANYTFQITVPQTVDTFSVELPYYCSDGSTYWAMLDEKTILSVNDWTRIEQANVWLMTEVPIAMKTPHVKPITREEFMEYYNSVIYKFTQKL